MTEYGLGIHRYKGADKHEDNDGILHHYIETNVPFMNPPNKDLGYLQQYTDCGDIYQ